MVKTRTIAKSCPKCSQNVAVASKTCNKCSYSFKKSYGTTPAQNKVDERNKRTSNTRTSRKPNFYDSQQFEKKKKRKKRVRQLVDHEEKCDKKESAVSKAKRRLKKKEEEEGGNNLISKLSIEKQRLASLILAEINRKINVVQWTPT